MAWAGRDLKNNLVPTPLPWTGTPSARPGCSRSPFPPYSLKTKLNHLQTTEMMHGKVNVWKMGPFHSWVPARGMGQHSWQLGRGFSSSVVYSAFFWVLHFVRCKIKDPSCCENRRQRQLLLQKARAVSRAGKGGKAWGRARPIAHPRRSSVFHPLCHILPSYNTPHFTALYCLSPHSSHHPYTSVRE